MSADASFARPASRRRPPALVRAAAARLLVVALAPGLCGCPVTAPLPKEAEIQDLRLPEGGRYYLYVPSTYDRERVYPLIITCHGTEPWDTAFAQIREWAAFAERQNLIVAAPFLGGTRGDFRPPADKQLALQRADEQTILQLVSVLKASRNIAEEQVFLTGWSAGAFAVLHTGLRNPGVFRALAIRQGTFESAYMADIPSDRLDRWQRVFVYYGSTDPLRDESVACIEWLREQKLFVERLELPGSHRRSDVRIAWEFFEKIVRRQPWIRLQAAKPDTSNRRRVQFWCDTKPAARSYRWDFGDGETSTEANPIHLYAKPRRYEASCVVHLKGGKAYRRTIVVRIGPSPAP